MAQHKWHKEIKAWADGAEIEGRWHDDTQMWSDWGKVGFISLFGENDWEFRIKPQPKEPKYLYIYGKGMGIELTLGQLEDRTLIGKIKLGQDDETN